MVRILIVDDHDVVRRGVAALLQAEPCIELVGEAISAAEAVERAIALTPDIVIMDMVLPDGGGLQAAASILQRLPATKFIALSQQCEGKMVTEALALGFLGYVAKRCAVGHLVEAVRSAKNGQIYLSPSVIGTVVGKLVQKDSPRGAAGAAEAPAALSERESEVLTMVANGQSTKQIAAELGISLKTVETHRRRIMAKLKIFSVAGLTKYAIREHLTTA